MGVKKTHKNRKGGRGGSKARHVSVIALNHRHTASFIKNVDKIKVCCSNRGTWYILMCCTLKLFFSLMLAYFSANCKEAKLVIVL